MNPYDNAETLLRVLAAPRRNQFFYGKRMDVQHFSMEQDYGRLKQSLLNRLDGRQGRAVRTARRARRRAPVRRSRCRDRRARARDRRAGAKLHRRAGRTGPQRVLHAVGVLSRVQRRLPARARVGLRTRTDCAPGTTVETFCFKFTPGLAPLQDDPRWCAGVPDGRGPEPSPAPRRRLPVRLARAVSADALAANRATPGLARPCMRSQAAAICCATADPRALRCRRRRRLRPARGDPR